MTAPPLAAPPPSDGPVPGSTAAGTTTGAPDDPQVPVHRGWIAGVMILFWPLAIPAVLAANRAARAHGAGDLATARREAQGARAHARLGVLIGAVCMTLTLTFDITLVVVSAQHGPGLLDQIGIETSAEAAPGTYRSAAAPHREPITVHPLELQTGDCFMIPDDELVWEGIDVIPCSRLHDGLVIGVTEHTQDRFPGAKAIADEAWYDCWARYDSYSGTVGTEDSPVWTFDPITEDWPEGRRTSVCFIEAPFPVRGEFSSYPQIFEPGADS